MSSKPLFIKTARNLVGGANPAKICQAARRTRRISAKRRGERGEYLPSGEANAAHEIWREYPL